MAYDLIIYDPILSVFTNQGHRQYSKSGFICSSIQIMLSDIVWLLYNIYIKYGMF